MHCAGGGRGDKRKERNSKQRRTRHQEGLRRAPGGGFISSLVPLWTRLLPSVPAVAPVLPMRGSAPLLPPPELLLAAPRRQLSRKG
jgi:hypothetical protein